MEWIDEFFKVISIYLSSLRWKSIVHANTHTNVGNNNPVLFFYLLTSSLSPLYLQDKPLSPPNEQDIKIHTVRSVEDRVNNTRRKIFFASGTMDSRRDEKPQSVLPIVSTGGF